MAYAISEDGIHWKRPNLHITEGTNEILPERGTPTDKLTQYEGITPENFRPDSTTVFIDYDTKDPSERYKMFMRNPGPTMPGLAAVSADGLHWEKVRFTAPLGDRSTMFYNPFRKKWVYSIRANFSSRSREYAECDNYLEGADWSGRNVPWLCADQTDRPNAYIGVTPALYNVDCVAYESVMLGMFEVFYGPENDVCFRTGAPKITELIPMFSRDGFHFTRPSNESMIPASMQKGAWDRGYVQSVGGVCIVRKDELWFYYIGFAGDESRGGMGDPNDCQFDTMYANGATGIAKLRRDGFVSLETETQGRLCTRLLTFTQQKNRFFINAEVSENGFLKGCILDEKNNVLAESKPFQGDSTCAPLDFGDFDLASLQGKRFRVRFDLCRGKIYSFWLSNQENGASGGYGAAGYVDE